MNVKKTKWFWVGLISDAPKPLHQNSMTCIPSFDPSCIRLANNEYKLKNKLEKQDNY